MRERSNENSGQVRFLLAKPRICGTTCPSEFAEAMRLGAKPRLQFSPGIPAEIVDIPVV